MNDRTLKEPKLAAPGAGLPPLQWAVANYILLPIQFATCNKEKAQGIFQKETDLILNKAASYDQKLLAVRQLVPPMRGLEDSSRYWSIAMTMEHLNITLIAQTKLLKDLCTGGTDLSPVFTKDLKPSVDLDVGATIAKFRSVTASYLSVAGSCDIDAYPRVKFQHPWFGPLNAKEWLVMIAIHQTIHRRQIDEIAKSFQTLGPT